MLMLSYEKFFVSCIGSLERNIILLIVGKHRLKVAGKLSASDQKSLLGISDLSTNSTLG